MASDHSAATPPLGVRLGALQPEDFTSHDLPVVMRGYDRDRVDRLLARIAGAYASTLHQNQALRERLHALEADIAAAEDEARASAKSVAELMQRAAPATGQQPPTRKALREFEARLGRSERDRDQARADLREATGRAAGLEEQLGRSERDRKQAVADLQEASARLGELGGRFEALEQERQVLAQRQAEVPPAEAADDEAARLLVAAATAAEDVRDASRARALRTLLGARERAKRLDEQLEREQASLVEAQRRSAEVEHESAEILASLSEAQRRRDEVAHEAAEILASLAEAQQRRDEVEQEADEILARARTEGDRLAASVEQDVQRVRALLTGTLASLEAEVGKEGLMTDLESRLHEAKEPAGTEHGN